MRAASHRFRLEDVDHPLLFAPLARLRQQTLEATRQWVHAPFHNFGAVRRRAVAQEHRCAPPDGTCRPRSSSTSENEVLPGERYSERKNATDNVDFRCRFGRPVEDPAILADRAAILVPALDVLTA